MPTPIPSNRVQLSLGEVASATSGSLRGGGADTRVCGVTTDSRGELAGKLFVALEGERFDGHRFVDDAAARGAAAALVRRGAVSSAAVPLCEVDDTLDALGSLAREHRRRWGGRLIAVGGSAGKTTTRAVITALLEGLVPGQVCYAAGNLNNRIGVPMVLLTLQAGHRLCVVEIGTNQRGEVAALARVAEPDVAVLTLVALEHASGIGDLDAIEREEGALLAALGPQGVAIANADDVRAQRQLDASPAGRRVGYGRSPRSRYRVVDRRPAGSWGSSVLLERPGAAPPLGGEGTPNGPERMQAEVALLGEPAALAVAAAVAAVDAVIEPRPSAEVLARRLASTEIGEPGRLVPVELADGTLVLDDTYNANPASVRAALAAAKELATARGSGLVVVLGEMLELGECSAREHSQLGEAVARSGARALVAVAGEAVRMVAPAAAGGTEAVFAGDATCALERALGLVRPGDVVLVKASRGVRAERVVEGLVHERGRAA